MKYQLLGIAFITNALISFAYAENSTHITAFDSIDSASIKLLTLDEKQATRGEYFRGTQYNPAITQARNWCQSRGTNCHFRGWYGAAEAASWENNRWVRRSY